MSNKDRPAGDSFSRKKNYKLRVLSHQRPDHLVYIPRRTLESLAPPSNDSFPFELLRAILE